MTAQINDVFHFGGRPHAIAGISEGSLFDPALLDLRPTFCCTACYRGYLADFAMRDNRLVLATLHVNLTRGTFDREPLAGPTINGVVPTGRKEPHDWFNNHYEGIDYYLEYTGGVLLADGFLHELYVHMGFHPAWKYERVVELIFEAGILRRAIDQSQRMAELRAQILASGDSSFTGKGLEHDAIQSFIDRAFDRRYRM